MKIRSLFFLFLASCLVSCGDKYYTINDFSSILKVDSHVHINSNDGAFEDIAAADSFLLITLGVDHGDSANMANQLEYAVNSVEKHPGKVFYGSSFVFDTAGFGSMEWIFNTETDITNGIAGGAIAVKIWKNVGMTVQDRDGKFIMIDDPRMDDIIRYIIYKGLPITGHLGEPRNCWLPLDKMTVSSDSSYFARNPQYHMFLHPEYPSYEDQINARDHLLELHPDLTFIACHLASLEYSVDELAKRLDKFPNMAADMSARICHLQYQSATDREKVRNFIIKYQDRLMYGTDSGYSGSNNPEGFKNRMHETWLDDWKYFTTNEEMTSNKFKGKFTGLQLPKDVVRKIYSENAIKWYKLKI